MPDLPMSLDLVALKATLILVGAMAVAFVLRRASGSSRHTLWTATTVALLALPLLESQLPELPVAWLPAADPLESAAQAEVASPILMSVGANDLRATDRLHELSRSEAQPVASAPRGAGFWLAATWLLGIVGFGIPVVLGVLRSRRLIARATDVTDARILDRFYRAADDVGVAVDVALRVSSDVRTPMTGGVVRPVVLLPAGAPHWSDDCLDAVLRHELVHVRQRDALRQLASRFSVVIYWFHPLAWRAARLGALARELACDESVLRLGTRPSRYARHLLALADPMPAPVGMPALVRLDHPHLEERVMAILRASPPPASRRLSLSAAMIIFGWTAVVAAAAPTVRKVVAEERPAAADSYPVELAAMAPDVGATLPEPLEELAPLADLEPLMVQDADCENLRDSRTRSVSGTNGPVRMFTTDHEGTRICVTIRGDDVDRDAFIPRGRLADGVVLTLGTSNGDGERRLEIEGTSRGNQHRWFVDGRSRPFDSEAAEWRDAMLELVGVLTEQADADRARAVEAIGVARRDLREATQEMQRMRELESRAATRARASAEVAARIAGGVEERRIRSGDMRPREVEAVGRAAEIRAQAMAEVAEAHARATADVARHMDEVVAAGVGRGTGGRAVIAPRAARGGTMVAPRATGGGAMVAPRARGVDSELERARLEELRASLHERQGEMREHAEELREHAAEMEREHRRMAEEIRSHAPVISEGRAGARLHGVPAAPRAVGGVPVPPAPAAVPSIREREVTSRELEAAERLRRAIRVTGET